VASALETRSFSPDYARDIIGIDFSGDSTSLFIRSSDGYLNDEVSLWEVTSGRELRRFRIGTDVRGTALSTDAGQLAVAKRAGGVELWNVANKRRIRTLDRGSADGVAFRPDGRALAIAAPGRLTLWETGSGTQLATLPVTFEDDTGRTERGEDHRRIALQPRRQMARVP
jgi:WD40 repeat protein